MSSSSQSVFTILRQVWHFFERQDHIRFGWIWVLLLINGVLEIGGLALIIPIISILTDPQWKQNWPLLHDIQIFLAIESRGNFVITLAVSLFVYFLVRNAFRIIVMAIAFTFTSRIHVRLSSKMIDSVLMQSYGWLSESNSSRHIKLVHGDVSGIMQFLQSGIVFCAELVSVLAIVFLLVANDPFIFLAIIVCLLVPAYIFQKVVRAYLHKVSSLLHIKSIGTIQMLREAFDAIKEVKVTVSEKRMINRYARQQRDIVYMHRNYVLLQELPKILLENVFIGTMMVVIVFHTLLQDTVASSLSFLGILAIAGFRSIPVINKGIVIVNSAHFLSRSIQAVQSQLATPVPIVKTSAKKIFYPFEHIQCNNLSFAYKENAVFKNLSLTIRSGEMIGIVGASGGGKTTLVDLLLGLLSPTEGRVLVNGIDITEDPKQWKQMVAYVPQSVFMRDNDVRHNVAFTASGEDIDDNLVNEAIQSAQLGDVVASMPKGIYNQIGEGGVKLSGGQKQRLGIARALYRQSPFLVLDEATSALDSKTESQFIDTLATIHGKYTIIIIAHRMTTIAHCDRVYRVEKGSLTPVEQ